MSFLRFRKLRVWLLLLAAACPPLALADAVTDVQQLAHKGQTALAIQMAQRHIADNPSHAQMRFLLGVLQSESGQQALAMQTYQALTQEYPELAEPYNNLAVLLAAQGELGKAREALEMALRANPDYAVAHENLGDVYSTMAAQSYQRSSQLDALHSTAAPKLKVLQTLKPLRIE